MFVLYSQGAKSTTDEKGASAIFAQRMDDNELNGAAVQVGDASLPVTH